MTEDAMSKVGEVARAIAKEKGDDYDLTPRNKSHWVDERGMFAGRFRDVNEPFQTDYDGMARAAIEAMMEPTEGMISAGWTGYEGAGEGVSNSDVLGIWQAMISAALEG